MPTIFGHKLSTPAVVAIAGGSVVVIWFAWRQHKQSAAAAGSGIDSLTGLPASQDSQTDPLTGMTYLAEAQQYGSVAAAEQAAAGQASIDYSGAYGTSTGPIGAATGTPLVSANTVQSATYASNAAWAQAATAGLSDIGYSSTDIAAALGSYLGGLPLTSTQASIVQAAVAEYGQPPVSAPPITLAPAATTAAAGTTSTGTTASTGTTTTTTSTGTTAAAPTVIVPNLAGESAGSAHNVLVSVGLVPVAAAGQLATWVVSSTSPAAGSRVAPGTRVTINAAAAKAAAAPAVTVTVPNLAGEAAGEAHNVLVAAGLVPVAPKGQTSNMKVSYTNPAAGSKVAKGTRVTIETSGYVT